jgi:RNA polymerase sigma-70 factor (ECF subfamily)
MDDPLFNRPLDAVGAGRFRTTHWSLVLRAAGTEDAACQEALERLCSAYWPPVYTFILRRGHPPESAQDLTQGFFARLLEKEWLRSADATKGRFRTFLLTAITRFLANTHAHGQAEKRGGGHEPIPFDIVTESVWTTPLQPNRTPEEEFDRRWAETLLERVLARLREEFDGGGRPGRFEELKSFLTGAPQDRSYADVAARLGVSESAVKSGIYRLRQRYGELVREEIAETVESPAEIDAEIRYLVSVVAG